MGERRASDPCRCAPSKPKARVMLIEGVLIALAVLIGYPLLIVIIGFIMALYREIPNDPDAP
jgi:hypothetical protein